jgi:hypothetical protein
MRVTKEFSHGLTVATLVSQLPFALLPLVLFVCQRCAAHVRAMPRPAGVLGRLGAVLRSSMAKAGQVPQPRSVSIGKLGSRAHSPIEPS